ncbi:TRAP transporter small permease [Paenochrobactrum glaciei]|uniref:TRAP transporter small permease n=1 Tax=Paenochrobactrum glaciei TaxID=486407 RepID=UPI0031CFE9BA
MKWLDRIAQLIGSVLPACCLAIVLIVVTMNVFARTVLGMPFHMAHDIAILAFGGLVWLGLTGVASSRQLFGVAFFTSLLPSSLKKAADILCHLIVILISCFVIHAAYHQIMTARFSKFLALGWPKWIVSAMLLFSFAVIVFVQIRQVIELLKVPDSKEERTSC